MLCVSVSVCALVRLAYKTLREARSGSVQVVCCVSASVCALVRLAYVTLREARASSVQAAQQLCTAVQRVFELYCDVMPAQHGDLIAAVPLVAGTHVYDAPKIDKSEESLSCKTRTLAQLRARI